MLSSAFLPSKEGKKRDPGNEVVSDSGKSPKLFRRLVVFFNMVVTLSEGNGDYSRFCMDFLYVDVCM